MPVFIFQTDNGVEGMSEMGYYGVPMIDVPGIKASAHYCGPTVHPDARPASAGGPVEVCGATLAGSEAEASAAARVSSVVESTSRLISENFPHVEHVPFETQSCLYTSTPDHDYVLGCVPGLESRVVLAGGGSGHAFKMGPAIGEMAAAAALKYDAPLPLEPFSLERLISGRLPDERRAGRR
mmetsp:Transcript_17204/g.52000  ORF Transcript_17204/g.52000 Transcript_17204/m.52000 type:complete len:182 (+) Transcript_17204:420-965(+)